MVNNLLADKDNLARDRRGPTFRDVSDKLSCVRDRKRVLCSCPSSYGTKFQTFAGVSSYFLCTVD